ncbi:MAG: choice-of-anchor J domain-containing protein [Fulvivirga sp.]|uniref:choice-of-anchor J domain-containing protein n=1 Tax=Fulvivirga sp. TaxID=1931237 RepID=UPI0032F03DE0
MMNKLYYIYILFAAFIIASCSNDDDVLDQPTVTYYPSVATIIDEPVEGSQEVITVSLELSARLGNVSSVLVKIETSDVIYGNGFTTEPAAVDNEVLIEFQENETVASFNIIITNDADINPSDEIEFRIADLGGGIQSIGQGTYTLQISDIDPGECNQFTFGRTIREYDFDTCPEFDSPDGFTQYFIEGFKDDRGFQCRRFGEAGTPGIQASAFGGSAGDDNAWLILNEPFNIDELGNIIIQFSVESFFAGPGTIDLVYSSSYPGTGQPDQEGVAWFRMGDVRNQLPAAGSQGFNQIISGPCITEGEEVYFGFHFYGASSSGSSSWSVDNLKFMVDDGQTGTLGPNFNLPFEDDLNSCNDFAIPGNFIQERIPGSKTDRGWYCDGNGDGGSQALKAFANGGSAGEVDAWLISAKAFDLSTVSSANLSFDVKVNADGDGDLNILWSTDYEGDGDPSLASWSLVEAVTLPAQSVSFSTLTVDLADAVGEIAYVAFQFTGATNASSVDFNLDNIAITSGTGGGGGGGGNNATDAGNCNLTGAGTVIVAHDFEGCTDDFSTPSGFTEVFGPGSKTDRGWGCRNDGTDGSRGVRASAFGGVEGFDDAWLIMNPIDVSAFTEVSITVDVQSPFDGPGDLLILYSSDYSGSGDPYAATWTELSNVESQLPTKGAGEFATVSTAPCDMSGGSVYVAFQYVNGTSSASAAWSIDNLEVRGN